MTIEEALNAIAQMPANGVLVARPPLTWGSEALFIELTEDHRLPQSFKDAGYEYLLGRDDIERLLKFTKKKKLNSRAVAEFVIHYSVVDSYPAWFEDIPNA